MDRAYFWWQSRQPSRQHRPSRNSGVSDSCWVPGWIQTAAMVEPVAVEAVAVATEQHLRQQSQQLWAKWPQGELQWAKWWWPQAATGWAMHSPALCPCHQTMANGAMVCVAGPTPATHNRKFPGTPVAWQLRGSDTKCRTWLVGLCLTAQPQSSFVNAT